MIDIDEIISTHKRLDQELQIALSTMERKDTVKDIRRQIKENQKRCPHMSIRYNLAEENGICPYCGRKKKQ